MRNSATYSQILYQVRDLNLIASEYNIVPIVNTFLCHLQRVQLKPSEYKRLINEGWVLRIIRTQLQNQIEEAVK